MTKTKTHFIHLEKGFESHAIEVNEFDTLIEEEYDTIVIVTPRARYVSTLDDWLDFGYVDLDGDVEVKVLGRSYMGKL